MFDNCPIPKKHKPTGRNYESDGLEGGDYWISNKPQQNKFGFQKDEKIHRSASFQSNQTIAIRKGRRLFFQTNTVERSIDTDLAINTQHNGVQTGLETDGRLRCSRTTRNGRNHDNHHGSNHDDEADQLHSPWTEVQYPDRPQQQQPHFHAPTAKTNHRGFHFSNQSIESTSKNTSVVQCAG